MLQPDKLPFIDVSGRLRAIHSLSLFDRRYFLTLRNEALKLAGEADVRVIYDSSPIFAQLVDACLLLSGVSPAWVDASMACRMLFGLGEEEPLLMSLNFPQQEAAEGSEPLPVSYDPDLYNVAALWSHTEDLEQALRLARDESWVMLSKVLKARAHQLREAQPETKDRKQAEQSASKLKKLAQSGDLDDLLNLGGLT